MRQTVLAKPHHHGRVHGIQPIFRKQHFLRAAHHEHAVRLVECDFSRQAVGAHPAHLGPTHRKTTLVRHAMKHAVQRDPTGAGFEPGIGPLFGLLFCLDLEVERPQQGGAEHVALERGGVGRKRASFQTNVKRPHVCLKIPLAHGTLPVQPTGFHVQFVVQHVVATTHLVQSGTVTFGQTHHSARIACELGSLTLVQPEGHEATTNKPSARVGVVQQPLGEKPRGVGHVRFGPLTVLGGRREKRRMRVPPLPSRAVGSLKQHVHALEVSPNRFSERLTGFLKSIHQGHHLALTPSLQVSKPRTKRLLDPLDLSSPERRGGLLHVF